MCYVDPTRLDNMGTCFDLGGAGKVREKGGVNGVM